MSETQPFTASPLAALHSPASLLDALISDVDERRAALEAGRQLGPITSIKPLDAILSGRLEVGLHGVLGGPGSGKTALCIQIAANSGVPSLFVSGEIGMVEMLRRLTASRTQTYLNRFKNGEFSGAHVRALATRALSDLGMLGILDSTQHAAPVDHILRCLDQVRNAPAASEARGPGALLVIDSLHSWSGKAISGNLNEYERLAQGFAELETLAHGAGVPVLFISEQTKEGQKEAGAGGGGLNSGAGHRRISYAPETVISLHREKSAKEDTFGWVKVSLSIDKNRHGKTGSVPLEWNGGFQTFRAVEGE